MTALAIFKQSFETAKMIFVLRKDQLLLLFLGVFLITPLFNIESGAGSNGVIK